MQHIRKVPVLVVGGGPVGLALAVALDRFGVDCLIVERSPTTTDHPKSRGCLVRTMELFRQWGVEKAIRSRGLAGETDVWLMMERLVGPEYGCTKPEPRKGESPTWKSMVPQDVVEEELLKAARAGKHATVRYSTEMVDFENLGDSVSVRVRDVRSGEIETWQAEWLVAADGAGSATRRAAGIEMVGPPCLGVMLNEYIRLDLSNLPIARQAALIRVVPRDQGRPVISLLNTNAADRWLMVMRVGAAEDERTPEQREMNIGEFFRHYVGRDDLVATSINSSTWRMSKQVAASFRKGRVLLAGDAAHRFPPTGGFGLNTGVQDAHNLAWKLAYVLNGRATEKLIDTYDEERRPIAQANADFSYGNSLRIPHVDRAMRSNNRERIDFWIEDLDNHLHSVGQSLGFIYESGAVIADGSTPPMHSARYYDPADRPGSRFPHLWLDADCTQSTLDWFDKDFVLAVGDEADGWITAADEVSRQLNMPLIARRLPRNAGDAGCRIGRKGAALVRPDGQVAWRIAWSASDATSQLASAVTTVLSASG
jgi:2-polyprenyl-6-methoxyphenol hydroxylase-like FAD-dependent oxidoreductase